MKTEIVPENQQPKSLYKMKLRLFLTMAALAALALVFSACNTTDYYHDRAVQRARKFLIQEDKNLTLAQQEYIKYNKPVIMAEPIFPKFSSDSATSGTLSHVCIAWILPGEKIAHVVFGFSDNRLRDWTPNRVIIKRYDQPLRKYHKAKLAAVVFAMNNFLYLSDKQRNIIRFEVPETIISDYKFNPAKLKALKITPEQLKSLVQVTFIWRSLRPGHRIFVCGAGAKDMGGWKPIFGGETPVAELRKKFLAPLSFGQNITETEEQKKILPPQKKIEKKKVQEPEKIKSPVKETPGKAVKAAPASEKTKPTVKETPAKNVKETAVKPKAETTVKEAEEKTKEQ